MAKIVHKKSFLPNYRVTSLKIFPLFDHTFPLINRKDSEGSKQNKSDPSFSVELGKDKCKFGKILIVDDSQSVCNAIRELLKLEGYTVYTALGGKEAIQLSQVHYFDLVLMDLIMPDLNGLETFKKIKAIQPNIKSVLITGNLEMAMEFYIEAIEEGMHEEYLRKPFYNEEIIEVVNKYVKQRPSEE